MLGLIDTFDVNIENNVPTFFSTFLLVSCAALLAVIANQPAVARREAAYWRWLCLIFLFLALDEDASLHELLIEPMKRHLPLDGPLFFAWVIPYGLAVLVVGLLFLKFVLRLPARTRRLVIVAVTLRPAMSKVSASPRATPGVIIADMVRLLSC